MKIQSCHHYFPDADPASMTLQDFKGMRVKELRKFLKERKASCEGCVEKKHLVERSFEVRSDPIVEDKSEPEKPKQETTEAAGEGESKPSETSGGSGSTEEATQQKKEQKTEKVPEQEDKKSNKASKREKKKKSNKKSGTEDKKQAGKKGGTMSEVPGWQQIPLYVSCITCSSRSGVARLKSCAVKKPRTTRLNAWYVEGVFTLGAHFFEFAVFGRTLTKYALLLATRLEQFRASLFALQLFFY